MNEENSTKTIIDQMPTHVLDLLLEVLLKVMRAERGSIMLLDENRGELRIRSARGLKADIIEKARVFLGSGVSGKVAASGQSIFLKGLSGGRRLNIKRDELINHEIDTSYVTPIRFYDGTAGIVNINSLNSDHEIRPDKERLVQGILQRFLEYLARTEPSLGHHDETSQLYMMNIFREYNTLKELRVLFDFIFHLVTDFLKTQKKGVFLLKNQESGFFDLVQGYGLDTKHYPEIYEELIPRLIEPKAESARQTIIFNRKELFSASLTPFNEEFYILMPLVARDQTQGHIFLFAGEPPMFDEDTKGNLELLCSDAAEAIKKASSGRGYREMTFTDSLTGTYNYGLWWKRLLEEFSRIQRTRDTRISLMALDIDHLDRLNNAHGFFVGDQLLRNVADRIKSCLRLNDIVGRIGGDEFGVVLPYTTKQDALTVADRILQAVSSLSGEIRIQLSHPCTLSGGIAAFPDDADVPGKLVEKAKTALVSAKSMGGNRIEFFQHTKE